jgi:actin-related protein
VCDTFILHFISPITFAWQGANALATWTSAEPATLESLMVTRQDYLEHGSVICQRVFDKLSI